MDNVVKKHSISSELAQKMVDEAMAKARELGVAENVAILDDGGNLKAFGRMDGAPILCIEIAQNKAYTALFGVSTQDFFNFIQSDPSLLAGMPTLARVAAWGGGFPIKVDGEIVGAIGVSGAPAVQNDVDCARAALALVPDAVSADSRNNRLLSSVSHHVAASTAERIVRATDVTFDFSGRLLDLKGYLGHRRPSASVDAATSRTVFQRLGDESDERWIFHPESGLDRTP